MVGKSFFPDFLAILHDFVKKQNYFTGGKKLELRPYL